MKQPRIKIPLTFVDVLLDINGWFFLVGTWVLVITNYSNLPEKIPIHYNLKGQVDDFGNKWHLLILPVISSIFYITMTILNKYPHIFNYPNVITADNAVKNYTNATFIVRILKLIIVVVFGLIVFRTLQIAKGIETELGTWFLPLSIILLCIPLIYFIARKIKKYQ